MTRYFSYYLSDDVQVKAAVTILSIVFCGKKGKTFEVKINYLLG